MSHAPGTWVKFTADARLRTVTSVGHFEQRGMNEGMLIGEQREGVIVQQVNPDAYTVIFPDTDQFGWSYSYEMYPIVGRPRKELTFKKVK